MMSTSIVNTRYGTLRGSYAADLHVFRGIPFAQPPLGHLRFQPPLPPNPWSGTRETVRFGAPAAQNSDDPFSAALHQEAPDCSEDCLTLNVWTPGLDDARRPVLVWFHGGSFLRGSASWPPYDGAALARRGNVVVVTIQYRLGALGYLYLNEICHGDSPSASNLGLHDQIAALEWVRDEIAGFGGAPGNVTVFGQSCGAISIGILLGTPRARGLFHRAILQSGPPFAIAPQDATPVAVTFLRALELSAAEAFRLRDVPVERILAAQRVCAASPGNRPLDLPFIPVIDGDLLPRHPTDAIRAGISRDVDVLVGTTLDEMTPYLVIEPETMPLDDHQLILRAQHVLRGTDSSGTIFTDRIQAERLVDVYRRARSARGVPTDATALWLAIKGDRFVRYPAARLAETQRAHRARAYMYLFTWPSPYMGGMFGACHMLDVPFVFGTVQDPMVQPFAGSGPDVHRLAERIQDAWINFARTGAPSHEGLGDWPPYDSERRATMILGAECRVEHAPLEAERQAWQEAREPA